MTRCFRVVTAQRPTAARVEPVVPESLKGQVFLSATEIDRLREKRIAAALVESQCGTFTRSAGFRPTVWPRAINPLRRPLDGRGRFFHFVNLFAQRLDLSFQTRIFRAQLIVQYFRVCLPFLSF